MVSVTRYAESKYVYINHTYRPWVGEGVWYTVVVFVRNKLLSTRPCPASFRDVLATDEFDGIARENLEYLMRQETLQRPAWLAVRVSPACVKVWYTEHTLKRSYLFTLPPKPLCPDTTVYNDSVL